MPHKPFKTSRHTTNGKRDPSNRPFPGYVGGTCTVAGDTLTVELDRAGCSLRGLPNITPLKADGTEWTDFEILAASLNSTTLTVQYNTDISISFSGAKFAPKDDALRGPRGEYGTTGTITAALEPLTVIEAQVDLGAARDLYIRFNRPIVFNNAEAMLIDYVIPDPDNPGDSEICHADELSTEQVEPDRLHITPNSREPHGTEDPNMTTDGLGACCTGDPDGTPATDVTDFPITSL